VKHQTALEELIDRHLQGELTESEMESLAETLDQDPAARKDLVEQVLWDTRFTEILQETGATSDTAGELPTHKARRQPASVPSRPWLLTVAAAMILALSAGLYFQQRLAERRIAELSGQFPITDLPIARITGLGGSLIWTGDRGQIVRDIRIGTELAGGTIEGMAPDSWFELKFNDHSTVMISGNSVLTFSDTGQKQLRLKVGSFSASVVPQPAGRPMLIHTRSALLKVLGTQFDIEAGLTSTVLNVSEGVVRVRQLSDGSEADVPAQHRVIAGADRKLIPERVPTPVDHWKTRVHMQSGNYGQWLPATKLRTACQKAIPLVPTENPDVTLYLAGFAVGRDVGSPIIVQAGSRFAVRGRLTASARVHFGIRMTNAGGEMVGMFRGDPGQQQPLARVDGDGNFEEIFLLDHFRLDPCVRDRKDELATRPDGLFLDSVWAFTGTGGPSGLEITEIELLPPEISSPAD